jgi:hypothetical protein
MGLILDSSIAILAERRRYSVEELLSEVIDRVGEQEVALSAIGLTEIVHGLHRAKTQEI